MLGSKWNDSDFRRKKEAQLQSRAQGGTGSVRGFFSSPTVKSFTSKIGGDNLVRIIDASWPGATHYGYDLYVHYQVGPDRAAVLCLRMINKECPLCTEVELAQRNNDVEYVTKFSRKHRVLVYVVDRRNMEAGPIPWIMPQSVDRSIAEQSKDVATGEMLFVDDPDHGFDVAVSRIGEGKNTKYSVVISRTESKLSNNPIETKKWLELVADHPLPSLLQYLTAEQIKEMMSGNVVEESNIPLTSENGEDDGPVVESNNGSGEETAFIKGKVMAMKRPELVGFIKSKKLSLNSDYYENVRDLQEAVLMELGIA